MARLAVLLLLCILPSLTLAAVVPTRSVSVTISASPSYQRPDEPITLTAHSPVEKGVYVYTWTANGEIIGELIDLDRIAIPSGKAGTRTVITVSLRDPSGIVRGRAEYTIQPADVDIVWEGETYTPPFYKGKAFASGESTIIIEAIPHILIDGREVPANDLLYSWEADGKKLLTLSGYGKSSIRIPPARFRTATNVRVTVETTDKSVAARSTVSIPHVSPRVVVYEERPLVGTWLNRAVSGTVRFRGEEMSFRAVPFFFTNPQSATFDWLLDRQPIEIASGDPAVATLRKTGTGGGTFTIGVVAATSGAVFEYSTASFNLSFD